MNIKFYYATFQRVNETGGFTTHSLVDKDSHPFLWMKIQKELHNREFAILFFKEITEEEYIYFATNF